MTKAGGVFTAMAAAAVLVAVIPSAARAANGYDGMWSVTIFTQAGNCPSSLRYSVRVAKGRVYGDDQSYDVNGFVAPNGATRVTVSEKGQSASGPPAGLSGDAGRLPGQSAGRSRPPSACTPAMCPARFRARLDSCQYSDIQWGMSED